MPPIEWIDIVAAVLTGIATGAVYYFLSRDLQSSNVWQRKHLQAAVQHPWRDAVMVAFVFLGSYTIVYDVGAWTGWLSTEMGLSKYGIAAGFGGGHLAGLLRLARQKRQLET